MDVQVTRKIRSRIDDKVRRNSSIVIKRTSQGGDSNAVNILKSAEIKADVTQLIFGISFVFRRLVKKTYIVQEDMVINSQRYNENDLAMSAATLTYLYDGAEIAYTYGSLLSQYDKLFIIPTSLGMITLMGEIKL